MPAIMNRQPRSAAAAPPVALPGSVPDAAVPYRPIPLTLPDMLRRVLLLAVGARLLHRDCLAVFEALLLYLDHDSGRLCVSQKALAARAALGGTQLNECLAAMEAAGVLTRWRRCRLVAPPPGWRGPVRRQQMTTAYLLHFPEPEPADTIPSGWELVAEVEAVPDCGSAGRSPFPIRKKLYRAAPALAALADAEDGDNDPPAVEPGDVKGGMARRRDCGGEGLGNSRGEAMAAAGRGHGNAPVPGGGDRLAAALARLGQAIAERARETPAPA